MRVSCSTAGAGGKTWVFKSGMGGSQADDGCDPKLPLKKTQSRTLDETRKR